MRWYACCGAIRIKPNDVGFVSAVAQAIEGRPNHVVHQCVSCGVERWFRSARAFRIWQERQAEWIKRRREGAGRD